MIFKLIEMILAELKISENKKSVSKQFNFVIGIKMKLTSCYPQGKHKYG